MRAQNNNHNKKETINTMTAMSRPQSPAAAEPGEEDPAQQPQPIALDDLRHCCRAPVAHTRVRE